MKWVIDLCIKVFRDAERVHVPPPNWACKRGGGRDMVDDEDEAFEQELKAAPWGYGQPIDIFFVIAQLKRHGLHREAKWLLDEWAVLTHR